VSFEGWNEYAVALRGPIVRTLLQAIGSSAERWTSRTRSPSSRGRARPASIALDYWFCNPNLLQVRSVPWAGADRTSSQTALVAMIAEAEVIDRHHQFLLQARGVADGGAPSPRYVAVWTCEIHHSHRDALPSTELAWIAATAHYGRLLRAGARLYENRHGEHSKIVVTDGSTGGFGSYNFEHAAHDRLAEAMIESRDPAAVRPALAIPRRAAKASRQRRGLTSLAERPSGAVADQAGPLEPIQKVDVRLSSPE
jgi:hypothetical protein